MNPLVLDKTEVTYLVAAAALKLKFGKLPVMLVRMNQDLSMGEDLLKETGAGNLFTVFGEPDILVEKNLAYRCTPLHVHYTRNITLENNIFAFGDTEEVTRAGVFDTPLLEYSFQRNVVYFKQGRVVGSWNPANRNCAYDRNLYWNTSGEPLLFGDKGLGFAEWQAAGKDLHSIIRDPLFVDPEHGDFRLRPGSPAAQIGFEPWDLSSVGPRPSSAASR